LKRFFASLIVLALLLLPTLAAAQAPAGAPAAQPEAKSPAQPEAAPRPCQPGPGGTCPMMTPEQMKQMQGKMAQCCMMQPGQGSPMCQQMQKQLDELQKCVEALEGKTKGKKK
jgi:TolA-binding protein